MASVVDATGLTGGEAIVLFEPSFAAQAGTCSTCTYDHGCGTKPRGAGCGDYAIAIAQSRAEERCRIGRELHDSTSQLLFALQLQVGRIKKLAPSGAGQLAAVDAEETLRELQREIRVLAYLAAEPEAAQDGLALSLQKLVSRFARVTQLEVVADFGEARDLASKEVAYGAYRIAQEALANVHRHAFATRVSVSAWTSSGNLELFVGDDGIGISEDRMRSDRPCGMGIDNIRARAEALGGTVTINDLSPGTGISVVLPLSGVRTIEMAA